MIKKVALIVMACAPICVYGMNGWKHFKFLKAAENGRLAEVAQLLNEKNVSVSFPDKWGSTALHSASFNGHKDMVQFLIDRGADTNAIDNDGCGSVHFAARMGHSEILKLLLKNKAYVDSADSGGVTALHNAVECQQDSAAVILMKHGASIEKADLSGWTAMHRAAQSGHIRTIRFLMKCGGDPFKKNEDGDTTFDVGSDSVCWNIQTLLLKPSLKRLLYLCGQSIKNKSILCPDVINRIADHWVKDAQIEYVQSEWHKYLQKRI